MKIAIWFPAKSSSVVQDSQDTGPENLHFHVEDSWWNFLHDALFSHTGLFGSIASGDDISSLINLEGTHDKAEQTDIHREMDRRTEPVE